MATNNHTDISSRAVANASTFNIPLGQLDAAIGNRATLGISGTPTIVAALGTAAMTTTAQTIIGAINEIDAGLTTVSESVGTPNLMWDSLQQHINDKGNWSGKSWWQDNSAVSVIADSTHPYNGKTIRSTASGYGRGLYLKEVGLAPGDVISAGIMCKAATGTYRCRLIFRQTGPGGSATGTADGSYHTFSDDTYALTISGATIPAATAFVSIVPYSVSATSIDMYATWVHKSATAPDEPQPSPFTADYLRLKEWETSRKRLMVRYIGADNFAVYQPLQDGQIWIAWLFTKLATNNWTYYGANMASDNAGTGAYAGLVFDIGYSINYTPNGQSAETCGNHHEYDDFTSVNFYNEAGTVVNPTASTAAFECLKFRIEQKGTLRHPDTGSTDHATISRFIEVSLDGIYEHMRLSWLTDNNSVAYWNTGQLLASSATRAYVHNNGDAPFTTSDSTTTVTGKTRAYTWYHSRTFAFEVECPTAEAIQLRETTLKVYPRTIEVDATRDTGDVDHAEWYWRVVFDKTFANRI